MSDRERQKESLLQAQPFVAFLGGLVKQAQGGQAVDLQRRFNDIACRQIPCPPTRLEDHPVMTGLAQAIVGFANAYIQISVSGMLTPGQFLEIMSSSDPAQVPNQYKDTLVGHLASALGIIQENSIWLGPSPERVTEVDCWEDMAVALCVFLRDVWNSHCSVP